MLQRLRGHLMRVLHGLLLLMLRELLIQRGRLADTANRGSWRRMARFSGGGRG